MSRAREPSYGPAATARNDQAKAMTFAALNGLIPRTDEGDSMPQLTFDITMSLDGFVAGPNQTLEDPLGRGGMELHNWAIATEAWRERHGEEGGEANADSEVVAESLARQGALIMGRRMF